MFHGLMVFADFGNKVSITIHDVVLSIPYFLYAHRFFQVYARDDVNPETSARVTIPMANVPDEKPVITLGEDGVSVSFLLMQVLILTSRGKGNKKLRGKPDQNSWIFFHTERRSLEDCKTRPNTRHKMRLAVIWEKALRTDGPTDGHTLASYRDATAHLKKELGNENRFGGWFRHLWKRKGR